MDLMKMMKSAKQPKMRLFFDNGNMLEVSAIGFTLWDAKQSRWVVDASDLSNDNEIRVTDLRDGDKCDKSAFPSLYPKEAKKKAIKKKTKKTK